MKKLLTLSLVFAMTAVMLSGCGSTDSGSGSQQTDNADKAGEANKVKVIDVDLTKEQYAFGVDKDQPEQLQ